MNLKLLGRSLVLIILAMAMCSHNFVNTQSPSGLNRDTNAKLKAVFLYNFANYVNWPSSKKSGNFVIGVLGEYPSLISSCNQMVQSRKIGSQSIKVNKYATLNDLNQCHILYVTKDKTGDLSNIISKTKGKNILIVTDGPDLAKKGAHINFFSVDSKQKFEINKGNIVSNQLEVSSKLIDLADGVY